MLKEIVIAIQSYSEAHRFIQKHKLWKWIIIPGIIYAILLAVGMYFFGKSATYVIEYLSNATGLVLWQQKLENSLIGFLFAFAGVILWIILILFYFSLFKYLILIIGSPVFAYLSKKTERILAENENLVYWSEIKNDVWRGMKLAFRNLLWQTFFFIILLLLTLIPVAGWITPLVAIFLECYYYGFSMLDYSAGRHNIASGQTISFIGRHRGLSIGNGLVFYLMHVLIGIGWVAAPAYAIIAANLSLYKIKSS